MTPAALPPRSTKSSAVSLKILLPALALLLAAGVYYWRASRPPPPRPRPVLPLIGALGDYQVELTPIPYPMIPGHSSTLNLHLTHRGQLLRGATVHGVAHRPVFSPAEDVSFREFRDGEYTGELTPDQPGAWDINVIFMVAGTRRTINFPLIVEP